MSENPEQPPIEPVQPDLSEPPNIADPDDPQPSPPDVGRPPGADEPGEDANGNTP